MPDNIYDAIIMLATDIKTGAEVDVAEWCDYIITYAEEARKSNCASQVLNIKSDECEQNRSLRIMNCDPCESDVFPETKTLRFVAEDLIKSMSNGHIRIECDSGYPFEPVRLLHIADRIENKYKFMVEGLNGGIVERDQYIEKLTNENARLRAELNKDDCLKLANDVDRLRAENERLKAALQPVLDIVMDKHTSDLSMELAISEAKRIYNEGER